MYGEKPSLVDTATPDTAGHFIFLFSTERLPGIYRLILGKELFLDLIYNQENIRLETHISGLYDSLVIRESVENRLYIDFLRERNMWHRKMELMIPMVDYYPRDDPFYKEILIQFERVQQSFAGYISRQTEDHPEAYVTRIIRLYRPLYIDPEMPPSGRNPYIREHFFDNVGFTDVELIRSNAYTTLVIDYLSLYSNPSLGREELEASFQDAVQVIMDHASVNPVIYDFVVEYLVGGFRKFQFDKVLDYISEHYAPEHCDDGQQATDLETRLRKYADLAIGRTAPDISVPDTSGAVVRLSETGSKYTLVVFWASWCPHCMESVPEIGNIYLGQKEKQWEVMAVSLDSDENEWRQAARLQDYGWLSCCDLKGWNSPAAQNYNVYATPTMFLVDSDLTILAKPITIPELRSALLTYGLAD
ncbi:MAG: redoxin domain-containing protein [Bacteroidales bacterium]|nr:redoxin domain-containing protein [Bacteroidales bacterium]